MRERSLADRLARWAGLGLLVAATAAAGCAEEITSSTTSTTTTTTTSSGGGEGGAGGQGQGGAGGAGGEGGSVGPCAEDCSLIDTPMCLKAVCNEGQYPGQLYTCVVVDDDGAACDDGVFCTTQDTCNAGVCVGGPTNDCGMQPSQCHEVACQESTSSCVEVPSANGASCASANLCEVNTACQNGQCVGAPKDCTFSPLNECNIVACDPATGQCAAAMPDASKQGLSCNLTGDPCQVGKTCDMGQCVGGAPKDCSALTGGCVNGICQAQTGNCIADPIGPGGMCLEATDACNVGICDAAGMCNPMPVADGTACNDYNSCTGTDACAAGVCAGVPVAGCTSYFVDNFEAGCPPAGWTLGGDWQCGTPTGPGPGAAYGGQLCIGTQIGGYYNNSQTFGAAVAQTPTINLAGATQPVLQFRMWVEAESFFDGVNLKISTNGGATFTTMTNVVPAYDDTSGAEDVWAQEGSPSWRLYTADMGAYIGQDIILRWAFNSDGSVTYAGAYVDDIVVAEANTIPLQIETTSLPTAYVGSAYQTQITKSGGSAASVWSIVGGTNHSWLTIDPATGALSGTPSAANLGAFSVDVHVEEPALPSNFDDATLAGNVSPAPYYATSFEAACPNGWTLTGDWQCGTPSLVGPSAAYSGAQCIATQINASYNNNQTYAGTAATSPAISLAAAVNPVVTFRAWMVTEDFDYDGFNLKVSTNGTTFTPVAGVTPPQTALVSGESAWGGDESALGWRVYTGNLGAYAGQTIYLRFAFASDGSVTYPGVYIDDVVVSE